MTFFQLATSTPVLEIVRDLGIPFEGSRYLPLDGAVFAYTDHHQSFSGPFEDRPSVSFGIDASEVTGVVSSDYLLPSVEMFVSLIAREDVERGIFSSWQEEIRTFAQWDRTMVTLLHYSTATRERFGAWGGVNHRVLWDTVPLRLSELGIPFTVDEDPVSRQSISLANYELGNPDALHEMFTRACSKDGTYEGTAWIDVPDENQAEQLRHFFFSEEVSFAGKRRCTWEKAISLVLPGTYRSGTPDPVFTNRVVLIVNGKKSVLWERPESRLTTSQQVYDRSDKREYRRFDPVQQDEG